MQLTSHLTMQATFLTYLHPDLPITHHSTLWISPLQMISKHSWEATLAFARQSRNVSLWRNIFMSTIGRIPLKQSTRSRLGHRSNELALKIGGCSSSLPSSSICRSARSLKSFQSTNRVSFHASTRAHVHGKTVSPTTGTSGGLQKKKKKKGDRRDEKGKKSQAAIENRALGTIFFVLIYSRTITVTVKDL